MQHENPAVTVDVAVLNIQRGDLKIVLIQRKNPPFQGDWALPGGFLEPDEILMAAATRELKEETGIEGLTLYPIGMFDKLGRDPRGRTLTMAFWTLTNKKLNVQASTDAANVQLFSLKKLPKLAFDHEEIIHKLKEQLKHLYYNALPLFEAVQEIGIKQLREVLENM